MGFKVSLTDDASSSAGLARALFHSALSHATLAQSCKAKTSDSHAHSQLLGRRPARRPDFTIEAEFVSQAVRLSTAAVIAAGTPMHAAIDADIAIMEAGMNSALLTSFAEALGPHAICETNQWSLGRQARLSAAPYSAGLTAPPRHLRLALLCRPGIWCSPSCHAAD